MIPENNAVEESMEKESELGSTNQPRSPASTGSQESKLQKLKKSLSFKTKSIRSKSAENFFQRTYSDMKIDLCSEESLISSGQIQTSESQPSTPSKAAEQVDNKTHIFQEHMFKKPTFCDVCNHMIVGANTKYGLRCKACKMSIHHRCAESTGFQRCMGKLPKGFRRYYSSPLLINEQFGCIKEVMPIACGNKVDPVYEALRFGTSLAQKDKKSSSGSGSDSPNGNSAADLAEVPEERDSPLLMDISREHGDSVFCKENDIENLREDHQQKTIHSTVPTSTYVRLNKDPEDIFVALYKFLPQEIEDLAMRPGDRIIVLDDSNEDWWKGQIEEKVGYFPANFVQKFQKDAELFRCCKTFIGCKEQGQITLKENQICASYEKQHTDFLNVTTGKKKGFVPLNILEKI